MTLLVCALVVGGPAGGCGPTPQPLPAAGDRPPQLSAGTEYELRPGQTVQLPNPRQTLTFRRVVDDSRCPTGASCVWEGDASVELSLEARGDRPELVVLHTNPGMAQEASVAGVRLRLVRLEPYPESGRAIEAAGYRVYIAVDIQP